MSKLRMALMACILLALAVSPLVSAAAHNHTAADFREDLEFFSRELRKRHKNAFHYTSADKFDAAISELNAKLEMLDEDGFYVGLARIAAMVGDAHTFLSRPVDLQRLFPVAVHKFGDDYRILAVGP